MKTRNKFIHIALCTLALSALCLAGCGSDDDPADPGGGNNNGPVVLVLGDGGTEDHVKSTLSGAGFQVRDGGLFHEFTGDGLDEAAAVVLLAGIEYNNDMDDRGETALVAFVGAGGGLLTTEWLAYSIERSDHHQILQSVLPVSYAGSYASGGEAYTVMLDHPVTEGLPDTFTTGSDSQYSSVAPKSGAAQLVRGSRSGHAVVTWTRGGRVVAWNMAGEYGGSNVWNGNMDQLLVNATKFVSHW